MGKEKFSFSVIQLGAIKWHPVADIGDACPEFLQSLLLGFGTGGIVTGEIQLGIICVEIIPSVMGVPRGKVYIVKRMGPRMDPWVMPQVRGWKVDLWPDNATH